MWYKRDYKIIARCGKRKPNRNIEFGEGSCTVRHLCHRYISGGKTRKRLTNLVRHSEI